MLSEKNSKILDEESLLIEKSRNPKSLLFYTFNTIFLLTCTLIFIKSCHSRYDFNVNLKFGLSDTDNSQCGYNSCKIPSKSKLNLHIIAHTHDDVGWIKTVDEYWVGLGKIKKMEKSSKTSILRFSGGTTSCFRP